MRVLRGEGFDTIVNLYEISTWSGALRMWALIKFINAASSIGRNTLNKGRFFDRSIPDDPVEPFNQTHYFNGLARLLTANPSASLGSLWTEEEDKRSIDRLLASWGIGASEPFVLLNPGSDRLTRRWQNDYFTRVADHLTERYPLKLIFVGSGSETGIVNDIVNHMKNKAKAFSTAGRISISQLIELTRRSRLTITTNSAAMHIAGLTGVTFVAIAGSGNPHRDIPAGDENKMVLLWKKIECNPCDHWQCPKKDPMKCMKIITPEEVISHCERFLA
jgi:ADP-heptose:LPS heptosyltransferase